MAYRKCTSPVWKFFEPPTVTKVNGKDVKRVQCLLCTQQLADGGGPSNLMNLLQAKHVEEYKRCTNDSSKSCKTQSTLHSFSWMCPPECTTAITKCIAEFVAQDFRPFSVVDGQGFTRLPLSKLGGWSCVYPAVVTHITVWPYIENLNGTNRYEGTHTFQLCTQAKALQNSSSVQVDTMDPSLSNSMLMDLLSLHFHCDCENMYGWMKLCIFTITFRSLFVLLFGTPSLHLFSTYISDFSFLF